jgi:predicted nucleic acid-binding protein
MNVVSNASPLIALIRLGHLDLLRQLYGTVVIPDAVWHEVVVEGLTSLGRRQSALPPGSCGVQ